MHVIRFFVLSVLFLSAWDVIIISRRGCLFFQLTFRVFSVRLSAVRSLFYFFSRMALSLVLLLLYLFYSLVLFLLLSLLLQFRFTHLVCSL